MPSSSSNVDSPRWRKSSYSAGDGECVEVAIMAYAVAVRDSKDPYGPLLRFDVAAWRDFVESIRDGSFDRLAR
ncbi:MAG: DUF397 domain-containing protein [Micromonosporaceae bacterium]|nr:DUF397 domain-containing protein [Micromonosporaceae bacterium]